MSSSNYNIAEIRFAAHKKARYLSQITFGLVPICTPGIGTMAVDNNGRLYYDPTFLHEGQSLEELAGVFVHECMHIVLNHAARRKRMLGEYATQGELFDWNLATDAAINDTLRRNGIALVDGCVYPDSFNLPGNKSSEWYYDEIRKLREEDNSDCRVPPPPGDEENDDPGNDGGGTPPPGEEKVPSKSKGEGEGEGEGEPDGGDSNKGEGGEEYDGPPVDRSRGEGGSGSDGVQRDWELDEPDEETPGIADYDIDRLRRQTLQEMKSSVSRGNLAGDAEAAIEMVLEPKVDPLAELRAVVKYAVNSTHGYGEHTYKKRNPRQPRGTLRMPAHRQPCPEVRIIVDTSGSMNKKDLGLALGVVQKAVRHLQSGVEVVAADTDVRLCQKVFKAGDVRLVGRGGTNMARAMETVMEEYPRPNVLIVVTDGETPWPNKELPAKCVAAMTRERCSYGKPPEWIKVVKLEVEE